MRKLNITTWHPDTCPCTIEYSWHADTDENNRVHYFHNSAKSCDAHKHLHGKKEHYESVLEENQRKNKFFGFIEDHVKTLDPAMKADHKKYSFSFDEKRILHVSHPHLNNPDHKKHIEDIANEAFGPGKVIIH